MPYYDHICRKCGLIVEDENPSPPLCRNGHGLMVRKFTPVAIKVKGGTRKFHQNKKRERLAKWNEDRQEQEHQERQEAGELTRIDREMEKNYIAGELSYKHGHGSFEDERRIALKDADKGKPHGPEKLDGS